MRPPELPGEVPHLNEGLHDSNTAAPLASQGGADCAQIICKSVPNLHAHHRRICELMMIL